MGRKKGRGRAKTRGRSSGTANSTTAQNDVSDDPPSEAVTNESNPETGKRKSKTKQSNGKTLAMRLVDLPKLTKADIMCPICWSTLFEPTTLPCNHSLCEKCFRKHVTETSLSCPCCRMRLSVWSRKVMKDDKLLDEPLWARIRKEFPRLVRARLNGEDTQNIFGGDEEEEDEQEENISPDSSFMGGSDRPIRDGIICDEPGQIKDELQQMMLQHERDMEQERAREENASASLIKQIQEEENGQENLVNDTEEQDYLLAKKLQEEFQAQDRLERSMRSQQQKKSLPRNLMNEWSNSKASPGRSPKVSQSKPKTSRLSTNSSKSKSNNNSSKKPNLSKKKTSSSNSLNVSRASQDVMSRFLSSSQNQLLSPESLYSSDSAQPCCSKSLPDHDIRYSAFSPTKTPSSLRIIIPANSLAIPVSAAAVENISPVTSRPNEELAVTTKTPDSINSEVDRHFRPIRGAPKTPPRRRPDGTFLPEPKLFRATPVKPASSTVISAYICSPLKQMSIERKPSCATIEKRISNDSGRASDDSQSPDADTIGSSPARICKGSENVQTAQPYQNERRGRISEDYRVTPEDYSRTPESSKKRSHGDDNVDNINSDSKKAKVDDSTANNLLLGSPSSIPLARVKEEPGSPSLLEDSYNHQHLSFDIACTQGIITIDEDDEEYLEMERKALEICRKKADQEAADRAFALKLQRDLNKEERTQRGRNQYPLRSWLNKNAKQEVKNKASVRE